MAAHLTERSKFSLPTKWASPKDIFDIATEHGYTGTPGEREAGKVWLVEFSNDAIEESDLREAVQNYKYGIESITYGRWREDHLIMIVFKSAKNIKHVESYDLKGAHSGIVRLGKKKDFVASLIRGGCVFVGNGRDAKIVRPGSTGDGENAYKVPLADKFKTLCQYDDLFVLPDIAIENEIEVEEEVVSEE